MTATQIFKDQIAKNCTDHFTVTDQKFILRHLALEQTLGISGHCF